MQQIKKEAVMRGFALALAFLGVTATAEAASAAPAVTLSTAGNHPQGPVGVTGSGFGPGETVTFTFDTTQVLSLQADDTGAFSSKSLTVPTAAQPGTHTITAVGAATGNTVSSKFLVITNWSEDGYGPEHTGSNPYENTLSVNNVGRLASIWNRPVPVEPTGPAILGAGRLFLGAYEYQDNPPVYGLAKVQAASGSVAWVVKLGSQPFNKVTSAPAILENVIYAGAADNKVYALNSNTGAIYWSSPTGATDKGIGGSPIVVEGSVYAGSNDGNLYALQVTTGAVKWKFDTNGGRVWSPAVVGGVVYVTAQGVSNKPNGSVYALNAVTGAKLWAYNTTEAISTAPSVINGKVYFGTFNGHIYALDAVSGVSIWSEVLGTSFTNFAISNLLYCGNGDGNLYALNLSTGVIVWKAAVGNNGASPVIAQDVVYIPSGDGTLYAIDAVTGSILWSLATQDPASSVIVANGAAYFIGQISLYSYSHR